jgi:hypothetical protein
MNPLEIFEELISTGPEHRRDEASAMRNPKMGRTKYDLAKKLKMEDGTEISVQASEFHYCSPRDNDGPYSAVECGFPTMRLPSTFKKYADYFSEDDDDLDAWRKSDVYGWVPVEMVRDLILDHCPKLRQQLNRKSTELLDTKWDDK